MINTVHFSIVMPITLKERIDKLAKKNLTSKNHYIIHILERETKAK